MITVQNRRDKAINTPVLRNYLKRHNINATFFKKNRKPIWFVTRNDNKLTYRIYFDYEYQSYQIMNCNTKDEKWFPHATFALEYLLNNLI